MAFDKRAYGKEYNRDQTKQFTLRLKISDYEALQDYLAWKQEGFAPLVKRLIAEEQARDEWKIKE